MNSHKSKLITIVSDLHLGSGADPETSEYSRKEEFFYDVEFETFMDYLIRYGEKKKTDHTLILNGDIFDFLAVSELPTPEEVEKFGLEYNSSEKKYGLGSSQSKAAWKIRRIIAGHKVFFRALAKFLSAGNQIVYLRGNHDLEVYWPAVKKEIYKALVVELKKLGSPAEFANDNFIFKPWFHLEKDGELYVEHGNQYDKTNAITANLTPLLPEGAYESKERLLDYPIGSFFARYVYSPIRTLDPYRTHVISFLQYIGVVSKASIWNFINVARLNFPFFVRAVRNSVTFYGDRYEKVFESHVKKRNQYALDHNFSTKKLEELDQLRAIPLGHSMYQIFKEIFRPVFKRVVWTVALSLLAMFSWILIFTSLSSFLAGSIFGKASLISVLAVVTVVGLFYLFLKIGKAIENYRDPLIDIARGKASRISALLKVKKVVMGHTHIAEKKILPNGVEYLNTGTWIPFPGPWDKLQEQARQFTFAIYEDGELKLLRWNPKLKKFQYPLLFKELKGDEMIFFKDDD
ncbi:MAG: metallophosphoesterase [Deltaproteobacteria bacterium]|jgi:UDP-2,3-diacylglucosamine pyrophosphatase LpxH|nr:metallophosphoesterase [Deltaproteobacteria bacterium]